MNWLLEKLKKNIGEHKFLYLFMFFLFLRHSTCSSYQWDIVDIERKAPGKQPETEKHDLKLTVHVLENLTGFLDTSNFQQIIST